MLRFAQTCEAIAATTKKLEKTRIVADYLRSRNEEEAAVSAVFLSGRPFPMWEETTLQVGGRLLWRVVAELAGNESDLTAAYRRHGDLGAVAGEVLEERAEQGLEILEVSESFRGIAATRGPAAKSAQARDLLAQASPLEAKYIIKIMTGDLRIGLKESLVEEAIARAFAVIPREVQRANMLLGDIGETLRLASEGKLAEAKMRMFHPLGFMLASPVESAEEGLSYFAQAAVEDKYDGIRAQAHVSGGEVKLFSRTRDEITESFPELPEALAGLAVDAILDGEIVAWEYPGDSAAARETKGRQFDNAAKAQPDHAPQGLKPEPPRNLYGTAEAVPFPKPMTEASSGDGAAIVGKARPFSVLHQRLGRKKVSERMLREISVAYMAFDVLYAGDELLIDRPLRERARILDELLGKDRIHRRDTEARRKKPRAAGAQGELIFGEDEEDAAVTIMRAPVFRATSPQELEELFSAAQVRGNEGLMIKDLDSAYTPGKRGKSWLKMKRELATLDVVVTAVEYGHGKRIGVLSDYTFGVWEGERLVNIGKAYSGLTDAEIAEMTQWFLEHTIEDQGSRRVVEPKIVLEVAFNNMMRSDRHESGYALRFPRIVRLRRDKAAEEADTMARAREIFTLQAGS